MDKFEAERIINAYGKVIAESIGGVHQKSKLPCSVGKIKQAFFTYLVELSKNFGGIPDEIKESLVGAYSMLGSFVDDDEAEALWAIHRQIIDKKMNFNKPEDKERNLHYLRYVRNSVMDGKLFDEINEFIAECHKG